MTITRLQALIIAAGLALVGVAVARAGHEQPSPSERVLILDGRSVAQTYPLRDNRLRDEPPPGAPAAPGLPFSRL